MGGAEESSIAVGEPPARSFWTRARASLGGAAGARAALVVTLLAAQFSGHTLLMRYSRGVLRESYAPSSLVLLSESLKALVCLLAITLSGPADAAGERVGAALRGAQPKLLVPVGAFFAQNLLAIVALRNIPSSTFALLSQLKTAWTVLWSIALIGRRYGAGHWRAIALLVLASLLVDPSASKASTAAASSAGSTAVGVAAVLAMGTLSGFSSVYLEIILKGAPQVTIFERNLQLALCSLAPALLTCAVVGSLPDAARIASFESGATLGVVMLSALGGILVAAVMKFADNVVKCFATGAGLCVTAAASAWLFKDPLNRSSLSGIAVGVLSIFNFAAEPPPTQPTTQAQHSPVVATDSRKPAGADWRVTWMVVGLIFFLALAKETVFGNKPLTA